MADSCRVETKAYRQCLKDARTAGSSSKACTRLAVQLEACRERVRKEQNQGAHDFDGTRVLPNPQCRSHNYKMQTCLKWHAADESQCVDEIAALKSCLQQETGVVAAPTAGDKIWSDYKKKQKK